MTALQAIPAMVNAHSHAFQRDMRGAAERPAPEAAARDDFWSWRTAMFAAADRLDPERMRDVAARVYREMRAAGYGVVGEFHYVHHQPDGTPYDEPNALAQAVADGARDAGLAIVLIPAAYHRNGWDGRDRPPVGGQRRFCDPDVETFLTRVDALRAWAAGRPGVEVAVAAHSVRAVPASWLEAIAAYSEAHGLPRHVHAHEQRRELEECRAEHGCSPIALLERSGFLGPATSVIHGVHVSADDVRALAASDTIVVSCPTTEGNLGDGHLPAMVYREAGCDWRSAPTRRCGSIPSRRCASWRPAPAASASCAPGCWRARPTATCGPSWSPTGARASASTAARPPRRASGSTSRIRRSRASRERISPARGRPAPRRRSWRSRRRGA